MYPLGEGYRLCIMQSGLGLSLVYIFAEIVLTCVPRDNHRDLCILWERVIDSVYCRVG